MSGGGTAPCRTCTLSSNPSLAASSSVMHVNRFGDTSHQPAGPSGGLKYDAKVMLSRCQHHRQPSATRKAEARADTDEALTGTTRWLSSSLRTTRCAARSAWDILGQVCSRAARRSVRQTREVDCAVGNARLWSPALDHFPAEQTPLECYGASRRRSLDLGKPRVSNGPAPQHCAHVLYSVLWPSKEPASYAVPSGTRCICLHQLDATTCRQRPEIYITLQRVQYIAVCYPTC